MFFRFSHRALPAAPGHDVHDATTSQQIQWGHASLPPALRELPTLLRERAAALAGIRKQAGLPKRPAVGICRGVCALLHGNGGLLPHVQDDWGQACALHRDRLVCQCNRQGEFTHCHHRHRRCFLLSVSLSSTLCANQYHASSHLCLDLHTTGFPLPGLLPRTQLPPTLNSHQQACISGVDCRDASDRCRGLGFRV